MWPPVDNFNIFWYNSLIRINDRPVFYKHWSSHGISKISHLQAENGTLLRYDLSMSNEKLGKSWKLKPWKVFKIKITVLRQLSYEVFRWISSTKDHSDV